jgi:hypothetical protein
MADGLEMLYRSLPYTEHNTNNSGLVRNQNRAPPSNHMDRVGLEGQGRRALFTMWPLWLLDGGYRGSRYGDCNQHNAILLVH